MSKYLYISILLVLSSMNLALNAQVVIGDPLLMPNFLSKAYPGAQTIEGIYLSGALYGTFAGNTTSERFSAFSVGYHGFLPGKIYRPFSFGGYYQGAQIGTSFFQEERFGLAFSIPIFALKRQNIYVNFGGGLGANAWKMNWNFFQFSSFLYRYFQITSPISSQILSNFNRSTFEISYALQADYFITRDFMIQVGTEVKQANRANIVSSANLPPLIREYRKPSEYHTYVKFSYGISPLQQKIRSKILLEGYIIHNMLIDTVKTIFSPFGSAGKRRSESFTLGGSIGFKISPQRFITVDTYGKVPLGNFLNQDSSAGIIEPPISEFLEPVQLDTLPETGRVLGIRVGIGRPNNWQMKMGYSFRSFRPIPKPAHYVDITFIWILPNPFSGDKYRCRPFYFHQRRRRRI